MRCLRSPNNLTTGIIGGVGAIVLVAAIWLVADGAAGVAAVELADAVLVGLGTVLSALVAAAGILFAADIRADRDSARAWQSVHDPVAWTIEQPVEADATLGWHSAYATGPQDERLQAILKMHRFTTLMTTLAARRVVTAVSSASKSAEEPASASIDTEISISTRNLDSETIETIETTVRQHGLALVVNDATLKERNMRAMRGRPPRLVRSMGAVPKVRRIANSERWWSAHVVGAELASWSVAFKRAANVIVLADRNGRNHPPSPPDQSIDATALAQPACRGPPSGATIGRLSSTQSPFGRRHRAKVDAASELDALVVVDNLGDRVPVGAAELSVIETFLDDVLRDVLTGVGSGLDDSTT
jgi:hypothetical protein